MKEKNTFFGDVFTRELNRWKALHGMSQEDFAAEIGVEPNMITRYKQGRSLPSEGTMAAICRVLRVEPEMFRDGQYGDAYKELWLLKYGEPWSDPIADVRSIFLSQRLNVWTHSNAIKLYASYVNANEKVEHKYSLAPHSTLAYATYPGGITDGYVHMMGSGQVETVTGQTWSNTIINNIF